jgi:hypothetical protein
VNGETLGGRIDALYQLPLSEFVKARNDLAKSVKAANAAGSKRIRALVKPSVSAWVVNQLFWFERRAFDRLFEAGAAVRAVQQAMLAGAEAGSLAEATENRQDAIALLMRAAELAVLRGGHGRSAITLRRIGITLDTLANYGNEMPEPPPGRLSTDVEAPGFRLLSDLVGRAPLPQPKPRTAPRAAAPRPKPGSDELSRARLRRAEEAALAAEAALEEAGSRAKEAIAALEGARREGEAADHAVETARQALAAARDRAAKAFREVTFAEGRVKNRTAALKKAGGVSSLAEATLNELKGE